MELNRTYYDAGFDAAYEFDLFGGVRRSVQASEADLAAAEADQHSVQIDRDCRSRPAATSMHAWHNDGSRLREANLAAQDETLQIVGWRVQAGLVGSLDQEQARNCAHRLRQAPAGGAGFRHLP